MYISNVYSQSQELNSSHRIPVFMVTSLSLKCVVRYFFLEPLILLYCFNLVNFQGYYFLSPKWTFKNKFSFQ